MRTLLMGAGIFFTSMMLANADMIVVDGKQYSDVLVYESSDYYYVKLPRQGKSLSVARSKVSADQIEINDDPYYRDQLRELYNDVKLRGEIALKDAKPIDAAFVDAPQIAADIDTSALFAAGSGKPLSLSIADAQAAISQGGVNLTKSGDSLKGKSSDGILSIILSTSSGKLTGITGSINTADPTQLQQKAMPVIMLAGKVAPWAAQWIMGSQQDLMTNGSIQKSQGGVSIALGVSENGMTFNIKGT